MIHLICGTSQNTAHAKFEELIGALLAKNPDTHLLHYEGEQFDRDAILESTVVRGLFGKTICVIHDSLETSNKEIIFKELKKIADSSNDFFFLEGDILKKDEAVFKKHKAVIARFDEEKEKQEKFPIFSIADAVGKRDKKNAWVILEQALEENIAPENIHGILRWQLKNILLSKKESGSLKSVNPYVLRKARDFGKNFKDDELANYSEKLVTIYHDAHRGGLPLDLALEKFVLSL